MKDILLTTDGDTSIRQGDWEVGDSDAQHLACLAETNQGEWRQWPLLGIGVGQFLQDDISEAEIRHRVNVQAQYDGATVTEITYNDDTGKLTLNGYYS